MKKVFYLFFLLLALASCNVLNPSIMLKTGKDYQYAQLKDSTKEYKISPNDIINFRMYSNKGFKLIDLTSLNSSTTTNLNYAEGMNYLVEDNGMVKLPIIGKIKIAGMTAQDAEKMLEQKYSKFYINPFVLIKVTNQRVIVFPGSPGSAKVIPLSNNNTTLIEALALAGGISQNGKAKKIKLIRGDPKNPQVYLIDLSTINGIKLGNTVLQANDIIYVEPRKNISAELLKEITPVLSLLTSMLLVYGLLRGTKL